MFEVGREVELSFNQAYCRNTWFPATILEVLGNGKFLAEYCKSDTNSTTKPLKVAVDSIHVRPPPPLLKDRSFVLLEKVDAYFNFGWWSGVITKELDDNKYIVFFKQMKKKEFNGSQLRPHMEWKNGKWFMSQENVTHKQQVRENMSGNAVVAPVNNFGNRKDISHGKNSFSLNRRNYQSEQLTPVSEKPSRGARHVAQKRANVSDLQDAVSQPQKKSKERNEASQQDAHSGSSCKSLSGCLSPGAVGHMISLAMQSTAEPSTDNPSLGKQTTKHRTVGSTRNYGIVSTSGSKKTTVPLMQHESLEAEFEGKEPEAVGNTADDVRNGNGKETERSVVIGLPCTRMESSDFGMSRCENGLRTITKQFMNHADDQMQQLDYSTIQKLKDSNLSETGEVTEKRKRERPKRTPQKILQTPITEGSAQNRDAVADNSSGKDSNSQGITEVVISPKQQNKVLGEDKLADGQTEPTNRRVSMTRSTLAKMQNEEPSNDSIRLGQERSKRGRMKSTSEKPMPQVDDYLGASGGKAIDVNRMEVQEVGIEAPENNELDDEPLSRWMLGTNSPIVDGSGTSPVNTVEECIEESVHAVVPEEDNGNQPKTRNEASPVIEKKSVASNPQQSLPIKHTVLWKAIESMEVFQRIPQKPHFEPLKKHKESSREGLAIGYMVTFSNVFERASKLQFNDAKSVTDDILETLEDLERHGFDVGVVRDRVTRLVEVRDMKGNLAEEADELKNKLSVCNSAKSRIAEEIRETSEQIRKLQEKLSVAVLAKEKEDGEIMDLQSKLLKTEESIKNVELEFGSMAAASL